jgi:hypothetical protein
MAIMDHITQEKGNIDIQNVLIVSFELYLKPFK